MSAGLLALGLSHKTAPVALRERVALQERQAVDFVRALVDGDPIAEAVAISTCNRTELYVVADDAVAGETAALGALARLGDIRPTELAGSGVYSLRNCDAARHLYRVTSGLESMIVGENEVQGQVRRAYESALGAGTTGPLTNRLFAAALATGKRVRTETALATGPPSLSSVAVELARQVLGDLEDRSVLVLGAGETAELTARPLADRGARPVFVASRRHQRALALAERHGGRAVGFDRLPAELEAADIVVAATASPHAIVGPEELGVVMEARAGRPLLAIDIAVPRDIDPDCSALAGVTLYDIDDLQALIARNRSVRKAEARRAEAIIEEEIQRFAKWLGTLDAVPTIAALRRRADEVVEHVLGENAGRWETLSPRDRQRVEAVARSVASRLLHEPTLRLKRNEGDRAHARLQVLRELFALDEPLSGPAEETGPAEVRELRRRSTE
ncbi:MAG: glutamyl-tRNA reductase [Solirubrobacteraceae bacterium]